MIKAEQNALVPLVLIYTANEHFSSFNLNNTISAQVWAFVLRLIHPIHLYGPLLVS